MTSFYAKLLSLGIRFSVSAPNDVTYLKSVRYLYFGGISFVAVKVQSMEIIRI